MKTFKATRLEASSLSRVWQMWNDNERSFAILTAFRGDFKEPENIRRNLALGIDIRALGYGYFWLDGFYIENKGKEDERKVEEDSLFVSSSKGEAAKLKKDLMRLLKQYNQEAAVFKPEGSNGEIFLLKADGELISIGKNLLPNQVAQNYSRLRGGKGTFIFASASIRRTNLGVQLQLLELRSQYPAVAAALEEDN